MVYVSCLIPLYRSARFFDIICGNIDEHLVPGMEILISDRHGLDDTAPRLRERYAGNPQVHVLTTFDNGDWVTNICALISSSKGRYFRILPHDDSSTCASTLRLAKALDRHKDAVLAYGVVRAIDLEGRRLPERDQLNESESPTATDWDLDDALSLFWRGRFNGGFKGLVRADVVRSRHLLIKKTPTLVASERAWLFGLALAGRFHFVPEAELIKRYYDGSTSSAWAYTTGVYADVVNVMAEYCDDLIADPVARDHAKLSLVKNGNAMTEAVVGRAPLVYYSLNDILPPGTRLVHGGNATPDGFRKLARRLCLELRLIFVKVMAGAGVSAVFRRLG